MPVLRRIVQHRAGPGLDASGGHDDAKTPEPIQHLFHRTGHRSKAGHVRTQSEGGRSLLADVLNGLCLGRRPPAGHTDTGSGEGSRDRRADPRTTAVTSATFPSRLATAAD